MTSITLGYANTAGTLRSLQDNRATGELTITSRHGQWQLHFFCGRLIYSTGDLHRMRRWRRSLRRFCPDFHPNLPSQGRLGRSEDQPESKLWEYQVLSQAVAAGQLSVAQAKAVIQASLAEVLFAWVSTPGMLTNWQARQHMPIEHNTSLSLLLSPPQIDQVLLRTQTLWSQWKSLGLSTLSPHLAPRLNPVRQGDRREQPLPQAWAPYLRGNYSLWDIADLARCPITTVAKFLRPWLQLGLLSLEVIPDLPSLTGPSQGGAVAAIAPQAPNPGSLGRGHSSRPLIACIDDSLTVMQAIAAMLEPTGYRVLQIQDPLLGMAELVHQRPELIFLDLLMPNTSGHNLCGFLRRTPVFQHTPIVILSGHDNLVDRTRAHMAGANDFLCKPPKKQALFDILRQYLPAPKPVFYPAESLSPLMV